VPGHVERELFSYVACGIPAHGFALLRCDACDGSHVVPLDCASNCTSSARAVVLSNVASVR